MPSVLVHSFVNGNLFSFRVQQAVKKGDIIFVGQYLFTGSETTSVWLEVRDILCSGYLLFHTLHLPFLLKLLPVAVLVTAQNCIFTDYYLSGYRLFIGNMKSFAGI